MPGLNHRRPSSIKVGDIKEKLPSGAKVARYIITARHKLTGNRSVIDGAATAKEAKQLLESYSEHLELWDSFESETWEDGKKSSKKVWVSIRVEKILRETKSSFMVRLPNRKQFWVMKRDIRQPGNHYPDQKNCVVRINKAVLMEKNDDYDGIDGE